MIVTSQILCHKNFNVMKKKNEKCFYFIISCLNSLEIFLFSFRYFKPCDSYKIKVPIKKINKLQSKTAKCIYFEHG